MHAAFDLERLARECRGLRTGLAFTPAAWVPPHGDLGEFLKAHCDLRAFLALEPGLRGELQDGVAVESGTDARTGLPVYSLYGQSRGNSMAMMKGLDALVIDLQDIGARSYTYIVLTRWAMEACFANNVEVIVLDRPNPIGGSAIEGPLVEPGLFSFVGIAPIPIRHGLTVGELARCFSAEFALEADPSARSGRGLPRRVRAASTVR